MQTVASWTKPFPLSLDKGRLKEEMKYRRKTRKNHGINAQKYKRLKGKYPCLRNTQRAPVVWCQNSSWLGLLPSPRLLRMFSTSLPCLCGWRYSCFLGPPLSQFKFSDARLESRQPQPAGREDAVSDQLGWDPGCWNTVGIRRGRDRSVIWDCFHASGKLYLWPRKVIRGMRRAGDRPGSQGEKVRGEIHRKQICVFRLTKSLHSPGDPMLS